MLNISIVLYKNPLRQISNLIQDILASTNVSLDHIFLIDNSPDANLKQLAGLDRRIIYLANPNNPGYGAGHNLALKQSIAAKCKYHLVINPDIRFQPQVLSSLLRFCETKPYIGLLMPKICYPQGRDSQGLDPYGQIQLLCKLLPTPFNIFARRFLPQKYVAKMNFTYCMEFSGYTQLMEVPYLSGSFMLFRVADLAKIGVFDERFFMYFEDTDITRRFYRQHKAWFYPGIQVTHVHNQESYRSLKLFWVHIQNMWRYFNKYGWFWDAERRQINLNIKHQFLNKNN